MRRPSPSRRAAYLVAALAAVLIPLAASCGTERPGAGSGEGQNNVPAFCGTPNDGCECIEPGKVVECGQVKHSAGGYVACSMGHRTCIGGRWGACVGEYDVTTKTFTAGGGALGTRALGTGAPCPATGPMSNPCDPYCNQFVDDPTGLVLDGGFVVVDGGLTIPPGATADGGAPGGFSSTAGGVSNCGGATNIVGPACTPPGLATCQQDHRCDVTTNTCVWNGGPGYFDPLAGGIDLTVGAPCGPSGSGSAVAPVCNRGSAPLPAGSTVTLHVTGTLPSGCTDLGPPTLSFPLGVALAPGACTSFNIGNSLGNKFITVNAGAPGAVVEAPGLCANNSAAYKDDGAPACGDCTVCNTTLTGKVFDPSGVTNNLPLSGVEVFQPSGPLTPLTDGVQCDTCTSLQSPWQTQTVTDATGSFTLTNVSPGTAVPIVVQTGRWRRTVTLNVPACVTTPVPDGTLRMPRSRTDGYGGVANIPKMALVLGNAESLECWLRKVGMDTATELLPRTGPGDLHRIQLWANNPGNGLVTTPAASSVTSLLTPATLAEYTAVIMDCDGGVAYGGYSGSTSAAQRATLRDYANVGGKVFMDHWPGHYYLRAGAAPFNTVATWQNSATPSLPARGMVLTTSPLNVVFRDWLANVGASSDYGAGWVRVDVPRRDSLDPDPATTVQWIRGQSTNNWAGQPGGNYALSFSFETPVGSAPASCGRVIFNSMHVADARVNTSIPIPAGTPYPGACVLGFPLTPEEKALEYQLFQLTACQLGGAPPAPPPPPPAPLPVVTFVRDYRGVCPSGDRVVWGPLYWQADIPPGTNIAFRAATADTSAALPASPPAASPITTAVGSATVTTAPPGAWDCNGCPGGPVTVDSQLFADTGAGSKEYLRVYMTFTPNVAVPPTLLSWRQVYQCVPAE